MHPWPDHHSLCTLEASAGQYPSQPSMCVETASSVRLNHRLSAGYLNIFFDYFICKDKFKLHGKFVYSHIVQKVFIFQMQGLSKIEDKNCINSAVVMQV